MTVKDNSRDGNVFGSFPAMSLLMTHAMSDYAQTCARQMREAQGEVWRFVTHRLEADANTLQSALACRSMTDLLQVQQDWAQQASTDYAGEAERVLDIAGRLSEATTAPLGTILKVVNGEAKPVPDLARKG